MQRSENYKIGSELEGEPESFQGIISVNVAINECLMVFARIDPDVGEVLEGVAFQRKPDDDLRGYVRSLAIRTSPKSAKNKTIFKTFDRFHPVSTRLVISAIAVRGRVPSHLKMVLRNRGRQ